ncbi:MAG: hypothetical protein H7333_01770 [Bdellovibrionales bacterium]|nr:hypothetical protein [Oligoflexia bacterium]
MGLKTRAWSPFSSLTICISMTLLAACASHPPEEPASRSNVSARQTNEVDQTQIQIAKLQEKIQDLEVRLSALNDKINLENGFTSANSPAPGSPNSSSPLPTAVVEAPAAHGKVIPKVSIVKASKVAAHGEETFSNNEAIDRFREAKILYDSQRYSDAVLEFSEFVKNNPEHALSPAAQFFVGMSYVKQKEYKLGEEELSRGLLAYSHSGYIPDTLAALIDVSERLNKTTKVTYYREKLMSHFANSPQAKNLNHAKSEVSHSPVQTAPMQTDVEPSVVQVRGIERPEVPTVRAPVLEGANE